jgi:hypothetical protein
MRRAMLALILAFAAAPTAGAEGELDHALDGFDAPEEPAPSNAPAPGKTPSAEGGFEIDGDLFLASSYNYAHSAPPPGQADYRGLSRLQAGMRLSLDAEGPAGIHAHVSGRGVRDFAYRIRDHDEYTHIVLQTYESDLELGEAWLRFSPLPRVDVKVGRQIAVWGRSDTLRVLDVLNPVDEREPGIADLADMRLPVAMTRVDSYLGRWTATGIAIHESRQNKEPVPGSDFFPPITGVPIPGVRRPSHGGRNTQWAGALTGVFPGWDVSFHYASFFSEVPYLSGASPMSPGFLNFLSRHQLFGTGASWTHGNWLLKGEVAQRRGIRFASVQRRFSRTDFLAGIEYTASGSSQVALEMAVRQLHGFEGAVQQFPDFTRRRRTETSLRYSTSFWNDSLRATLLGIVFGEHAQDGTAYRLSFAYDLRDALVLEGGIVVFEEGELPPLSAFDENDRVYLGIKYSF